MKVSRYLFAFAALSIGCAAQGDGPGNGDKADQGGDGAQCVEDSECSSNLYCQERTCTPWKPAQQPHITGEFTPPAYFGPDPDTDDSSEGIFGMHAVLLQNGKVLLFAGHGFTNSFYAEESITWDPETGMSSRQDYNHDIFCSHHAVAADGTVIITGGGALPNFHLAKRKTWRFDPVQEKWSDAGGMEFERWYPTLLPLADGRLVAASGQSSPLPLEIFDPSAVDENGEFKNEWTIVPGSERLLPELYPSMRLLPNGQIYSPGIGWDFSDAAALLTLDKDGSGNDRATWTDAPAPAALHEQGDTTFHLDDRASPTKAVMRVYGGGIVGPRGTEATLPDGTKPEIRSVEEIDMTDPSAGPRWQPLEDMHHIRGNVTAVLLPDGKVWAVGGQTGGEWNSDKTKSGEYEIQYVYETEMYDPATNQWTLTKALMHPRQYHHTATLLPDGRVLVTAGQDPTKAGKLTGGQTRDIRSYEIYSPPYLFQKDGMPSVQPRITQVAEKVTYGQSFDVSVEVASGRSIEKAVMITPTSETHHTDTGRYIRLEHTSSGGNVTVTAPSSNTVAPPGYYLLFLVDSDGVPSVAKFVQVAQ